MKRRRSATISLALAILALTGVAAADGGDRQRDGGGFHESRGFDPGRMVSMMSRRLDLDDNQEQQLNNLVDSVRPEIERLRANSEMHQQALSELDVADPDYGAKVQDIAAARGATAAEWTTLRASLRADVHGILTDEQRTALATLEKDRPTWRGRQGRHQRHREGSPDQE